MTYIITDDDRTPFVVMPTILALAKYFSKRNTESIDDTTVPELVMEDFYRDASAKRALLH